LLRSSKSLNNEIMNEPMVKKKLLISVLGLFLIMKIGNASEQRILEIRSNLLPIMVFGEHGQIKMTYDNRQRPNCVLLKDNVYLAFNAGAAFGATGKSKTKPMVTAYNLKTGAFSEIVILGPESSDHHDGPVIWADMEEKLHVFHGWHHDLGKHLISTEPGIIGTTLNNWATAPPPAAKMSYPWMSRIYDGKQLVFYRTDGHYSSWTYRISGDDGKTWEGPENDVTDLDINGGMDTDWSLYAAKAVSNDGNFLHIGFHAYDDYKRVRSPEEIASGELDKSRQYNPLYDNRRVSYNYNLYYVIVDLRTHDVMNHEGDILQTPIDLSTANDNCMIWDTEWRGGSIVPSILVDENDEVSFLHNISDFQHEDSLDYHYVWFEEGEWKNTLITDSNHEWNSGHIARSADGTLHAYVITGEGYFEKAGYMDKHGGGNIEDWTSYDDGKSWEKVRDIIPDPTIFEGWKYNNIQPVKRPDGTTVDGMLLFYGWKHPDNPEAKAFLLDERVSNSSNVNKIESAAADSYLLDQNFPNPFNAFTTISYEILKRSNVKITVYDLSGRVVDILLDTTMQRGNYTLQWDASGMDSGVYCYRIQADGLTDVKKCLLVK
ncbi:hypothetical protein BVY01_02205, partial [bacterium I07]